VKVQPDWRDNLAMVQQLDWRTQLDQLSEAQSGPEEITGEEEEEAEDDIGGES
jgi:hypothetical protein